MQPNKPMCFTDPAECADYIVEIVGKKIVFALPLGLGKPNNIVNAVYNKAKMDSSIDLRIITALSLNPPTWSGDLERRMVEPLVERVWGGYVELDYVKDLAKNNVPSNVTIAEFFYKAGTYLSNPHMQENYISSNYTHANRDIINNGSNVMGSLISKNTIGGQLKYSLSCNPDVTLDIHDSFREEQDKGKVKLAVGEINDNLPFMYGDAVVDPEEFDVILENPKLTYPLFGTPKESVSNKDYMIGINASSLIKDGGTLQIGIGSLGDAIAYGMILRHGQNEVYQTVLKNTGLIDNFGQTVSRVGGVGPFEKGLYASTEMFVDTFLDLYNAGIMKRRVYDNVHIQKLVNAKEIQSEIPRDTLQVLLEEKAIQPVLTQEDVDFLTEYGILKEGVEYKDGGIVFGDRHMDADLTVPGNMDRLVDECLGTELKNGFWIHAGFFLGPTRFYDALNAMSDEERKRINMTSVLNVNQLYDNNKYSSLELKLLQRTDGRFINAGLMATMNGAIVSDALDNGKAISGVGGQFNFVTMAHELPGARSGIMIRSTRQKGSEVQSNIVYNYGHTTVPRHLRDMVITEYGIADIRSKPDNEIIKELLSVTDSRFQESLLQQAKKVGKISKSYQIPDAFKNNYPDKIADNLKSFKAQGLFPAYPFGTVLTKEEIEIGQSLRELNGKMSTNKFKCIAGLIGQFLTSIPENAKPYLERMKLDGPSSRQEKVMQKTVLYALKSTGQI